MFFGNMKPMIKLILVLWMQPWVVHGQIKVVQYWLDDNINGSTTIYPNEWSVRLSELDITNMPNGLHTLHIRAKDHHGFWSIVHSQLIYKPAAGNGKAGYEYWIDDDLQGKRTATDVADFSHIDVQEVENGLHLLHIRAIDAAGAVGSVCSYPFYKNNMSASTANAIDRYHYWYDGDFASRQEVTLPEAVNPYELREKYVLPEAFAEGEWHTFHIQFRDVAGRWSAVATDTFAVVPLFSEEEFEALKAFYASTGGEAWHSTQRGDSVWTLDRMETVNDWKGLSFSGGHVNCIRLTANNLSGTIPAALADGLSHLTALRVDSNRIEGVEAALPAVWALDLRGQQFDLGEKYVEPGEDWLIPVYNVSRYDYASGVLTTAHANQWRADGAGFLSGGTGRGRRGGLGAIRR